MKRLARCLALNFHPVLHAGRPLMLDLTQQVIADLSGVLRQRVSPTLRLLEEAGLLQTGCASMEVRDVAGLLNFRG